MDLVSNSGETCTFNRVVFITSKCGILPLNDMEDCPEGLLETTLQGLWPITLDYEAIFGISQPFYNHFSEDNETQILHVMLP